MAGVKALDQNNLNPQNLVNMAKSMFSSRAEASVCTTSQSICSERIKIGGGTFQVWRNYPLTAQNADITHAIIMVHGRSRNADDYFTYGIGAVEKAGRMDSTLVLSPYYRQDSDNKLDTDLYWRRKGRASRTDWAMGGKSYAPAKISSFAVLDDILKHLDNPNNFPNLKSLAIAGHSAGGQVVHRYAVSGNRQEPNLGFSVHYIPSNPSSYSYLSALRPSDDDGSNGDDGEVELSFGRYSGPECSYYNNWGYGLDDPNDYVDDYTKTQIISRYRQRQVTYLMGEKDTKERSLDQTCAANAQGENRIERARAYYDYIQTHYPTETQRFSLVPGVGHSGRRIFQSEQGLEALFMNAD
jgi:hypothetical protein